jgi:hypothetical protein
MLKRGAISTKLNAAVTNLYVQGIYMSHCRRHKNMEYIHLTG